MFFLSEKLPVIVYGQVKVQQQFPCKNVVE